MIRNEEDIELSFNGIPSGKTINAGALWARLVENAWANGEPGVLNGHLANKMNNLHYYKSLISTNPCGEIWLEPYGCCDLGALVLPRFVEDGRFDWDGLDESVRLGVRFLDNVLSVNHYPLPEIKDNCENVRRLGLGVMGLHTMLLEMRMTYDSRDAFSFVDRLFRTIKNTAYDASINLAIEKGPFPAYDARFLDSGFAKSLKRGIRNKIKEHGIRNCAMLTIAPTGTTSMVSGVSSGIEPIPAPVYWRNFYKPTDDGSRVLDKELVVEDAFYKYDPNILQSALDIPVKSHFEMQKIVQDHIDNAVSKTINMPADADMKAFGEMWLEYLPYCKGTTVYRYGSRENEPINPVPREQWDDVVKENQPVDEMTVEEFMFTDCVGGVCEVPQLWQDQSVPIATATT
jgi:ribonucleoside-diphosphate reductase alpha chain